MSSHPHDTKPADAWHTEIVPQLPANLESQARALGAFQRKRAFATATDLLRGLLAYATSTTSLRHLGCWGVLTEVADIAPSSWLERLRAAEPWLRWLVGTLLTQTRPRWLTQCVRGRVLLVDASSLRWTGGTGDDLRLHLAFDLIAGQIDQVVLTDQHTAEQLQHFTFRAGDLVVMDGGYAYRNRLAPLQQAQVDAITRCYPPTFPLETANGTRVDMRAWLDQPGSSQRSCLAWYTWAGRRYPVRVLARRQDERRRQAAQERARQRARQRQRALSAVVAYFADWIILVTTLLDTAAWPDVAIWRLYGARWQVERLFKALKQFLDVGDLPSLRAVSAVPLLWLRLLVWLLHAPVHATLQADLQTLADPAPSTLPGCPPQAEAVVSTWMLSAVLLDGTMQAIRGTWTQARVQDCLPHLRRYLVSHPRDDREHQQTEVVAWLSGVRRTRRRPLLDAVA